MESGIANVWRGVLDTMLSHMVGSVKNSSKRSIGLRNDDPKRIDHLYGRMDATNLLFSLVDSVSSYLESISNTDNSNITSSHSLKPAIDVLVFTSSTGKRQLSKML